MVQEWVRDVGIEKVFSLSFLFLSFLSLFFFGEFFGNFFLDLGFRGATSAGSGRANSHFWFLSPWCFNSWI